MQFLHSMSSLALSVENSFLPLVAHWLQSGVLLSRTLGPYSSAFSRLCGSILALCPHVSFRINEFLLLGAGTSGTDHCAWPAVCSPLWSPSWAAGHQDSRLLPRWTLLWLTVLLSVPSHSQVLETPLRSTLTILIVFTLYI